MSCSWIQVLTIRGGVYFCWWSPSVNAIKPINFPHTPCTFKHSCPTLTHHWHSPTPSRTHALTHSLSHTHSLSFSHFQAFMSMANTKAMNLDSSIILVTRIVNCNHGWWKEKCELVFLPSRILRRMSLYRTITNLIPTRLPPCTLILYPLTLWYYTPFYIITSPPPPPPTHPLHASKE